MLTFRIMRVNKVKYNLSVNCSLVLHGCYLYSKLIKPVFSKHAISVFITYWDYRIVSKYFNVLLKRGFIVDSGKTYCGHTLYCITDQVPDIIKEIEDSYSKEMYSFCSKYNIGL